jgi:hypothetical protein
MIKATLLSLASRRLVACGARSTGHGTLIDIPQNALPADINLANLVTKYSR